MDNECFQAYKSLVSEVTEGMEQVKQLRASFPSNEDTFLEKMVSSYEEALQILNGSAPEEQCQSVISSALDPPNSSASQSDVSRRGKYKRRKNVSMRTETIKVHTETGPQGIDDGYAWRKYGQKDVLGRKYPRSYFRCSHRFDWGCLATKHVQRLDDDPSVFEITYIGKHTCPNKLAPLENRSNADIVEDSLEAVAEPETSK